MKYFNSIELITLLADRDWLDDATKAIGQYWRRKNARRNGLITENHPNPGELLVGQLQFDLKRRAQVGSTFFSS